MSGAGPLVEVRSATAEEMDDFAYVTHTTLASHGRSHYDPMRDMRPEWTLCAFEDGALVTSSGAWPFSMRFNGARIAVAGVTAVGTLPHKRRRGYLGRTMLASLVRQRGAGQAIAILHAPLAAIYQRYGYAVVGGGVGLTRSIRGTCACVGGGRRRRERCGSATSASCRC